MNEFYYYNCDKCGGRYISTKKTPLCVFCRNEIFEKVCNCDFSSFYFGTFQKSMGDARKSYRKMCRHPFLPFSFRKKEIVQHMIQCYVPSYYFNTNVNGKVVYYGKDKKNNQKYQVDMKTNIDYKNEFVSLNQKIDSSLLNQVSDIFQYESFYNQLLEDGIVLDIDKDKENEIQLYHDELIENSLLKVKEKVPHDLKKVASKELEIQDISSKLVYLPIYFTKINYLGKEYPFMMNGEDGKITFRRVNSKISILIFSVIIFVIVSIFTYLLVKLF